MKGHIVVCLLAVHILQLLRVIWPSESREPGTPSGSLGLEASHFDTGVSFPGGIITTEPAPVPHPDFDVIITGHLVSFPVLLFGLLRL